MKCLKCQEKISSRPIKQGDEYFCSLECANEAFGWESEEEDYYDENDIEGLYNEDEE